VRSLPKVKSLKLLLCTIGINNVDLFDVNLHKYWNIHKKKKWTWALLYGLLRMALTNAFVLYANSTGSSATMEEFLRTLLAQYSPSCTPVTPAAPSTELHLIHINSLKIPSTAGVPQVEPQPRVRLLVCSVCPSTCVARKL
jgi:hypothetical protein